MPEKMRSNLYIIFSSCGVIYALNYEYVCEIIPCMDTVLVNGAPEYIRGLINYGGEICPVISLCSISAKEPDNVSAKSCIIMIKSSGSGNALIGILAGSFLGSFGFSENDIKPVGSGDYSAANGPLIGTAECPHGTAAVLSPGNFFKWMDWLEI